MRPNFDGKRVQLTHAAPTPSPSCCSRISNEENRISVNPFLVVGLYFLIFLWLTRGGCHFSAVEETALF